MEQTLKDIFSFLALILTALAMFGVPMVILNLNRNEETQVIQKVFDLWFIDMLLNQYLMALGEFDTESYANEPQAWLCYLFFFFATFFTMIVMLNMLIAIMGDTFSKVMENKHVNAIKSKLDLMYDLFAVLRI